MCIVVLYKCVGSSIPDLNGLVQTAAGKADIRRVECYTRNNVGVLVERVEARVRGDVPQLRRFVLTARSDFRAVWTEGTGTYLRVCGWDESKLEMVLMYLPKNSFTYPV